MLHEQALDRDAIGEEPGTHAAAVAAVQPHCLPRV
jgi:hypothetical protein